MDKHPKITVSAWELDDFLVSPLYDNRVYILAREEKVSAVIDRSVMPL